MVRAISVVGVAPLKFRTNTVKNIPLLWTGVHGSILANRARMLVSGSWRLSAKAHRSREELQKNSFVGGKVSLLAESGFLLIFRGVDLRQSTKVPEQA